MLKNPHLFGTNNNSEALTSSIKNSITGSYPDMADKEPFLVRFAVIVILVKRIPFALALQRCKVPF